MLSKNPNSVSLSLAIAASLSMSCVHAGDDAKTTRGPTVEVTARRESTAIDASLAAVRVIDRAEIARRQAGDLLELLRTEAGVDITRSGGVGQATTLFLRGSNSNHTLFLIDGVRVSSANSGLYDLAHLPLLEATTAVAEGRVRLDGQPYVWEADEMVYWLRESPAEPGEVERERERVHFEVAAPGEPPPGRRGQAATPRRRGSFRGSPFPPRRGRCN